MPRAVLADGLSNFHFESLSGMALLLLSCIGSIYFAEIRQSTMPVWYRLTTQVWTNGHFGTSQNLDGHRTGTRWAQDGHKEKRPSFPRAFLFFGCGGRI
jgi:hypothetical protein